MWALMASLDRVHNRCMFVTFMCGEVLRTVLVYHLNHHINTFIKATKCFYFIWSCSCFPESPPGGSAVCRCFSADERLCSLVSAADKQKTLIS